MISLKHQQKGFTILELLIATMVFSTIFLGATAALIQLGKLYYKGVVTDKTQETTRAIADQVNQQLQFSNETLTSTSALYDVTNGPDTPSGGKLNVTTFCIGNTRYSFRPNVQVNSGIPTGTFDLTNMRAQHGIWRDTVNGGCYAPDISLKDPTTTSGTGAGVPGSGIELLAQSMRVSKFTITCGADHICGMNLSLLYGDNDLLTPTPSATQVPTHCGSIIGDQWCAASQLNTNVVRRVAP